jgi:hypothetical protein
MMRESRTRNENTPCRVSVSSKGSMPTGRYILSVRTVAIQINNVEKPEKERGGAVFDATRKNRVRPRERAVPSI